MKLKWEAILEMNDENDNPTCWGALCDKRANRFCYISKTENDRYIVEVENLLGEIVELESFNSFGAAKRFVEDGEEIDIDLENYYLIEEYDTGICDIL